METTLGDVFWMSIHGAATGMLITVGLVVWLHASDLKARIKDDVPLHRRPYLILRYLPQHIHANSDYTAVGKSTLMGVLTAFVVTALGYFLVLGIYTAAT